MESRVEVPLDTLCSEFADHFSYLLKTQVEAAGSLLILAYERSHEFLGECERRQSIFQFLRHCRHAAAHNGKFHFNKKEPRYPAKWRNLSLGRELQDMPLFKTSIKDPRGSLSIGDPVYLLREIEQELFNQKCTK